LGTLPRTLRRWRYRYARWLGAGLAGLAATLGMSAALPAAPSTVEVMLAARDIPAGAEISPGDVSAATLPADTVAYAVPDRVVGRRAAAGIGAGEPVTEHRLSVRRQIPPGRVVMAIPAPTGMSSAWLRPGDHALAMVPTPDPAMAASGLALEDDQGFGHTASSRAIEVTVLAADAAQPDAGWAGGLEQAAFVLLSVAEDDAVIIASAAGGDSLYLAVTP
jgi:Flp pilus assembly protein CpaB